MPIFTPIVRTASLTLLAAGAVLSLSACGIVQSALESEGTVVESDGTTESEGTAEGVDQDVMELKVGDCFNETEMNTALSGGEVTGIPVIDCAEPHDAEFFHSEILPEGEFPGDEEIQSTATEVCEGTAFTDFVGIEWMNSEFYTSFLTPIAEGWAAGDREILCYITSEPGTTGTLANSGR